jgi:hypothetical protein
MINQDLFFDFYAFDLEANGFIVLFGAEICIWEGK